ncbi:DUF3953 domain-containing protein [Psychrobacillus sp. INOP01]|uniref:DUF3953 domain-containing protein n=1 Tax=Psychrobacillus sp. INOP01 TaxID=2829187 RepID=UPI001BAB5F0C|nr:DUF3953 domain-containing protein [Psychrobacillus sp. INOP01]QUG41691.1 DUF3953 domain-containing protein [Psychrobacillus sp. INOP01]
MLNRLRIPLLICAVVFGFLDLITPLELIPFMMLSLGTSMFLSGLDEFKKDKKAKYGYIFITISIILILVAVIKLFT